MTRIDQAMTAALNFPLTHIAARYQQMYDLSHTETLRHERELKRYLVLRSRVRGATLPTPRVLDQLWQVFLLYTRDYARFCDALGGFIHHLPNDEDSTPEQHAEDLRQYGELLAFYEEIFHETPPADVWPPVDELTSAPEEREMSWQTSTFSCQADFD